MIGDPVNPATEKERDHLELQTNSKKRPKLCVASIKYVYTFYSIKERNYSQSNSIASSFQIPTLKKV
jgi:hypothetical protein